MSELEMTDLCILCTTSASRWIKSVPGFEHWLYISQEKEKWNIIVLMAEVRANIGWKMEAGLESQAVCQMSLIKLVRLDLISIPWSMASPPLFPWILMTHPFCATHIWWMCSPSIVHKKCFGCTDDMETHKKGRNQPSAIFLASY
jgi:hypothetical protein